MEANSIYKQWYWNENIELRNFIHWEIFKDTGAKRHSLDFILVGGKQDLVTRFYKCGNFHFFIGQIKERFINCELEPSWHAFRSLGYLRFTENNEPVNLKNDFQQQIYGFDVIFDIDNKTFKKWWLKHQDLSNLEEIRKVIAEGLPLVKEETSLIKAVLDKYSVPYILNPSGTGFRIVIEWEDIKNYIKLGDYGSLDREFIKWVLKQVKCKSCKGEDFTNPHYPELHLEKCVTCNGTGVHQFKCFGEIQSGYALTRSLYSLHPISKYVSLPLDDKEFEEFTLDYIQPENVLKNIKIIKQKESLNKKRKGNFKEIFEAFKKDLPKDYKDYKQSIETKNIINPKIAEIKSMINQLSEQEKKELFKR